MAFRSQDDNCLDYIQKLKRDDGSGQRICGDVRFGLHVDDNDTMSPPFTDPPTPTQYDDSLLPLLAERLNFYPYHSLVSDAADIEPKGELKTHLYVSNRMLRAREAVKLRVVYTVYQVCDGQRVPHGMFHCGYGLCISDSLVNDGFVNCPFGDCIDETNCTNAKTANITARIVLYEPPKTTSSDSSSVIGWLVKFLIIICLIAFCATYCYTKRRQHKAKESQQEDMDDRGTESVEPSKHHPPVPGKHGGAYPAPPGGQLGNYPMSPPWAASPQQPSTHQQSHAAPSGYPGGPPPPSGGQAPRQPTHPAHHPRRSPATPTVERQGGQPPMGVTVSPGCPAPPTGTTAPLGSRWLASLTPSASVTCSVNNRGRLEVDGGLRLDSGVTYELWRSIPGSSAVASLRLPLQFALLRRLRLGS